MPNTLIRVNPEILDNTAAKIDQADSEYEKAYLKLYQEVDKMQSSWKGKDNTAYTNQIRGYQKTMIKISEVMKQYAQCLRSFARTYKETQEENATMASRL